MNVALLLEASGYAHYILGENGLAADPNVKRLFDEISARPGAQRAQDLKEKWVFKAEFNEETRHNCLRKIRPETVARMVFGSCYKSCSMG